MFILLIASTMPVPENTTGKYFSQVTLIKGKKIRVTLIKGKT